MKRHKPTAPNEQVIFFRLNRVCELNLSQPDRKCRRSLGEQYACHPVCVYIIFQIPVEGTAPEARHSHSACSYQGGVVVFGGLDRRGVPLGDIMVLRPNERGFSWERVEVQPPPVPRSVLIQSGRTVQFIKTEL